MEHLIRDVTSVLKRPRLMLQYVILNFFLLSVGTAAVVYVKKETIIQYQQGKTEIILNAAKNLDHFDLPEPLESDVDRIRSAAVESQSASKNFEMSKSASQ